MTAIERLQAEFLTEEQVAEFMGISVKRLRALLGEGKGPPYVPTSHRKKRFSESEFRRWLKDREVKPLTGRRPA